MNTNRDNDRASLRRMYKTMVEGIETGSYEPADHAAFDLWIQATRVVMGYERCRAQSRRLHSLTAYERRALGLLWEQGSMTLTELARAIPLSVPATSSMVNRLVTRGFIDRSADAADRRRLILRATSKLMHSMDAASFHGTVGVIESLATFSDEELATATRVLSCIYDAEDSFASDLEACNDDELRAKISGWESELDELDDGMLAARATDHAE